MNYLINTKPKQIQAQANCFCSLHIIDQIHVKLVREIDKLTLKKKIFNFKNQKSKIKNQKSKIKNQKSKFTFFVKSFPEVNFPITELYVEHIKF